MASPDLRTFAATNWSETWPPITQGKAGTPHASVLAIIGEESRINDDIRELLKSFLLNGWTFVSCLALLLAVGFGELRSYCLPLSFTLLLVGVFTGSLSTISKLRGAIDQSSTPSPYDTAVGEVVRKILSRFNARERAVLRALMVCEPWNRWKHLPNVGIPLYEQFEIIYKALDERLLVPADRDEESVQFVPQYLEPAKDMLFSLELRNVQ